MGHCLCFGSKKKDKRDKLNKTENESIARNRRQPNSAYKVAERRSGKVVAFVCYTLCVYFTAKYCLHSMLHDSF